MKIKELNRKNNIEHNKSVLKKYNSLKKVIEELNRREIPDTIVSLINVRIDKINTFSNLDKGLKRELRKSQSYIFTLLEKELKLVPKNFYRDRWMALGLSLFGVTLGVVYGSISGNMAYLGIGMPIGMVVGMAIGAVMDKKALEEGRQLDL